MKRLAFLLLAALASAATLAADADAQRQADVARRGADVMPFKLEATTHVFTKTRDGGIQRVIAKDRADREQIKLVRAHLREIRTEFLAGNFAGPSHIHGAAMPGLAELQSAKPGAIRIAYRNLPAGAELVYRTRSPRLVSALHQWFDAQVSDHGPDAMEGHMHHHHHEGEQR